MEVSRQVRVLRKPSKQSAIKSDTRAGAVTDFTTCSSVCARLYNLNCIAIGEEVIFVVWSCPRGMLLQELLRILLLLVSWSSSVKLLSLENLIVLLYIFDFFTSLISHPSDLWWWGLEGRNLAYGRWSSYPHWWDAVNANKKLSYITVY